MVLVAAVVAIAALSLVVAIAWTMAKGTLFGTGPSLTTETDKVRLYISESSGALAAKTYFEIPKAYLSNKAERDDGSESGVHWETGVHIVALFPTFEHFSDANRPEFESKRHNKVIGISALSRGPTADSLGYNRAGLGAYVRGRQGETAREGFAVYRIMMHDDEEATGRARTEELVVPSKRTDRIFVCGRDFGEDDPPSCTAVVDYSESIVIGYFFPRELLADWDQIERDALGLVHSFEVR